MVVDFGGGVVPRQQRNFGADSCECDEVFRLGHVQGLPINARRHSDHSPTCVAEGHCVYGFLHSPVIGGAVLRHRDYSGAHPLVLVAAIGTVLQRTRVE